MQHTKTCKRIYSQLYKIQLLFCGYAELCKALLKIIQVNNGIHEILRISQIVVNQMLFDM